MQYKFFEQQWDRLKSAYSAGSLGEERKRLMWEQVRNTPEDVFLRSVSAVIQEHTHTTLPPLSRFLESIRFFSPRINTRLDRLTPYFLHEECRDFGFVLLGDTVIACTECEKGRSIHPEELARIQEHYNTGAHYMRPGFISAFKSLPYDTQERIEPVEW